MDHEVFKTKIIKYDECQKGLTSMFYKFVDKSSTATRANKSITHTGIKYTHPLTPTYGVLI